MINALNFHAWGREKYRVLWVILDEVVLVPFGLIRFHGGIELIIGDMQTLLRVEVHALFHLLRHGSLFPHMKRIMKMITKPYLELLFGDQVHLLFIDFLIVQVHQEEALGLFGIEAGPCVVNGLNRIHAIARAFLGLFHTLATRHTPLTLLTIEHVLWVFVILLLLLVHKRRRITRQSRWGHGYAVHFF